MKLSDEILDIVKERNEQKPIATDSEAEPVYPNFVLNESFTGYTIGEETLLAWVRKIQKLEDTDG